MTDTPDAAAPPEDGAASADAREGSGALARAPEGELAGPQRMVALGAGRALEVGGEEGAERIQIRSAEGQVLLSIRMTAEGPVLAVAGVSLEIAAARTLSLSCETLRVQAAGDAAIEVGGSLREAVRGSAVREAGKAARLTAREVKVEASPGGVEIRANDDVDIVGERVRLNSDDPPMPLSWEEHRTRQALAKGQRRLAEGGAGGEDEGEGAAQGATPER